MAIKFWHYFLLSTFLMFSMIIYACITREQFYPIILLLVTSKISFLLIANMVLAVTLLFGQICIKIFFGTLRDVEYELILERVKYSITETCLALTIFRNDLSSNVFLIFLILLFLKIFHWLLRSRLDYLEQVARVTVSTHTLLFILLILLILIDSFICYQCILYSHSKGKTVIVLFAFEFGILILIAINNLVRYIINIIDGCYENGLHYKGLYLMILDLICDGLKFCTYAGFFCLVFVYYGLPIHIIRDVWMAFASFYQRLVSLIKYLKLTNRLEERFEDATSEELLEAHECLICREGMDRGKKLPCKHVFHLDCLRMWLQHQQTCPLCRSEIPIVALPTTPTTQNPTPVEAQNEGNDRLPNQNTRPMSHPILPAPAGSRDEHLHIPDTAPRYFLDEPFESTLTTTTPTSLQKIKKAIPGFFVVLSHEESDMQLLVDVKAEPSFSPNNPIMKTINQGTIVFVSEAREVPVGGSNDFAIIWLHLPYGWIPLERYDSDSPTTHIFTPIVRPYSPIVSRQTLLGETIATEPSPPSNTSILPRSAATPERSTSLRHRDPTSRRESRSVIRGRYQSSPSSISRAIIKAREDISALSLSLRETTTERTKLASSPTKPLYAPSPNGKSTPSDRVMRLLAMQQQIDVLASSILEIQESLYGVRQGLAAALADELNVQEQDVKRAYSGPSTSTAASPAPVPAPAPQSLPLQTPVSVLPAINQSVESSPTVLRSPTTTRIMKSTSPTPPEPALEPSSHSSSSPSSSSSTANDLRLARAKYFSSPKKEEKEQEDNEKSEEKEKNGEQSEDEKEEEEDDDENDKEEEEVVGEQSS